MSGAASRWDCAHAVIPCRSANSAHAHLYSGDSVLQCWFMSRMKLAFTRAPEPWMDMSQSRPDSAHLYFNTGTRAPITQWTCATQQISQQQVNPFVTKFTRLMFIGKD